MGIITKDGIIHTPSDGEILSKSNNLHIKQQAERVKADRQGEVARVLEQLKANMEKANSIHYEASPIRVYDVAESGSNFYVSTSRAIGSLSEHDRDVVENHTLLSITRIDRTNDGSMITYRLACDIEKY